MADTLEIRLTEKQVGEAIAQYMRAQGFTPTTWTPILTGFWATDTKLDGVVVTVEQKPATPSKGAK